MAAIIRPHHLPGPAPTPTRRRPDLRLVPAAGSGARSAPPAAPAPVVAVLGLVLLVVVALGAVAVGRGALAGLAPAAPPASAPASGATGGTEVVVRPGDTLWSIARRIQPSGDVRPLVDRLVSANGSTALQVGDRVVVPG